MLSNAHLLANVGFDTAESEPAKKFKTIANINNQIVNFASFFLFRCDALGEFSIFARAEEIVNLLMHQFFIRLNPLETRGRAAPREGDRVQERRGGGALARGAPRPRGHELGWHEFLIHNPKFINLSIFDDTLWMTLNLILVQPRPSCPELKF